MSGPIGPGAFVAVVGASGVGKDALLSYARERADGTARFPRRAITRPPAPGEDHDPMTEEQFAQARRQGAFAVCWHAHDLWYGIPASVDADVRDGLVVVANVSRGVIGELQARYRRLVVVRVTVSEEVRARRLRARSRETEQGIGRRLARQDPAPGHRVDAVIQNDGSLAEGGAKLLRIIQGNAGRWAGQQAREVTGNGVRPAPVPGTERGGAGLTVSLPPYWPAASEVIKLATLGVPSPVGRS